MPRRRDTSRPNLPPLSSILLVPSQALISPTSLEGTSFIAVDGRNPNHRGIHRVQGGTTHPHSNDDFINYSTTSFSTIGKGPAPTVKEGLSSSINATPMRHQAFAHYARDSIASTLQQGNEETNVLEIELSAPNIIQEPTQELAQERQTSSFHVGHYSQHVPEGCEEEFSLPLTDPDGAQDALLANTEGFDFQATLDVSKCSTSGHMLAVQNVESHKLGGIFRGCVFDDLALNDTAYSKAFRMRCPQTNMDDFFVEVELSPLVIEYVQTATMTEAGWEELLYIYVINSIRAS